MNGIFQAIHRAARSIAPCAFALTLALGTPVAAQNPFEAAVRVDDQIVTNFEISQRMRFLEVLNAQGDLRQQAIDALVNERLQVDAALRLGVSASPEEIEAGLNEFAARANLGPEQFLNQMGQAGIAPETVRDFIANGITWRNVVRTRFGSRAQITEEDIDEAIELGTVLGGGIEILLAEIIIPVTPENQANLVSELLRLREQIGGRTEVFSEAASRFSAAPTRENGGLTGWRPLQELPEGLRERFLTMGVGRVTEPVPLGGGQAYALFQMRGQREVEAPQLPITAIDYVSIAIPGGRSTEALTRAEQLRVSVDTCNDFNGVIPGGFERQSVAPGALPDDVALALRSLDNHEMSTSVTRNNGTVLLALMLCDRVTAEPEIGRDAVRERLVGQRIEAYANSYLEELRADANIVYLN
ncbi:peptidylprolyl isomerase [Hasllibacter sp. MH4015]|uniref:peptidylprolyl isomerase n=1 Tax=Hasllibacter sp. MH4015 TaxID=2854029 RepID=UPI001CD51676|nr:peptidylprolyl isomerase [Hasllibacter sp. MH4015]